MEKISKTFSEHKEFLNEALPFRPGFGTREAVPASTHWEYALDKMIARIKKITREPAETCAEKMSDSRRDLAAVDEKMHVIIEAGQYKYTLENAKKLDEQLRKLQKDLNQQTLEVEPYICRTEFIPKDLNDFQIEALRGYVIPQDYVAPAPFAQAETSSNEPATNHVDERPKQVEEPTHS